MPNDWITRIVFWLCVTLMVWAVAWCVVEVETAEHSDFRNDIETRDNSLQKEV